MSDFNPYSVLGIESTATDEQIRQAWRRKISECHTDTHGGDHTQAAAVNRARDILLDPEQRKRFDAGLGINRQPSIDETARTVILRVFATLLRTADPGANILDFLCLNLEEQLQHLNRQRAQCLTDLSILRARAARLRGPPDNFLQGAILAEVAKGEACLPIFDADERVLRRAQAILDDYHYAPLSTVSLVQVLTGHVPEGPFKSLLRGE